MSRTTKPCPGCGKIDRYRAADKVCDACANAIKKWNEHVEKVKTIPGVATVRLSEAYHWQPMFYFGGHCHGVEGLSETRDELAKLFKELAELACIDTLDSSDGWTLENTPFVYSVPVFKGEKAHLNYPTSNGSGGYSAPYGKMPKRLLDVIRALFDRTARFTEMAYLGGLQDGQDVLYQMTSGQISPANLQEQEIRLAKQIQNSAALHHRLGKKKVAKNLPGK